MSTSIEMRSTEKLLLILLLVFTFQANSFSHSLLLKDSVPGNNHKQWISPAVIFASGGAIAGIPALRKIEKSVYDGFNPTRKLTSIDVLYPICSRSSRFCHGCSRAQREKQAPTTICIVCFGEMSLLLSSFNQ